MLFNFEDGYTVKQIGELTNIEKGILIPILKSLLMSRILNVAAEEETTEQQYQQAEKCPFETKTQKDLPKISLYTKLTLNLNYSR